MRRERFLPIGKRIKQALLKEENEYGVANAERLQQFADRLIAKASQMPPKTGPPQTQLGVRY